MNRSFCTLMPQSIGTSPRPHSSSLLRGEVEELDAAIGVLRHRVVLPPHAGRHRDLARQLELVADVDAVFPRPERGRLLVAAVVLVEQRILQRGVARDRQAEQKIGVAVEQVRRRSARRAERRGAAA